MSFRKTRQLCIETLDLRRMLSVNAELFLDINEGEESGLIGAVDWVESNGYFYFSADDGIHGMELWRSDGTAEGTALVADINQLESSNPFSQADSDGSFPTGMVVYKDEVYFAATDEFGDELWKTDGTAEGTVRVKDIWEGGPSSFPQAITVFNDHLYFCAGTNAEGNELWKSDGTNAGTVLLADINPGQESSDPLQYYVFNDELFFQAVPSGESGPELFKTDGTTGGTTLVKNINLVNNLGSYPEVFFELNGELYFTAADGVTADNNFSTHIFKTDGTAKGTGKVTGERITFNLLNQPNVAVFNDHIYYGGFADGSAELFRTTGTAGQSELVVAAEVASVPAELAVANGELYFSGNDDTGRQLWKTNGEIGDQNVAVRLTDVDRGASGLFPSELTEFNGKLIFNGHNGTDTYQVWSTDGTQVEQLTNYTENELSESFNLFFEFGDKMFFRGANDVGLELWSITDDQPELLAGDVDGNGAVEFADFLILSSNFGKNVESRGDGDLDGNGIVNFTDFLILSENFGNSVDRAFADWA